jgi:TolA-binding protein
MKSLIIFLTLFLFISCSTKKTDKELFDDAKKNLTEKNIPEAVLSFDKLIEEYPESNLTPEALSELAAIYQNRQVKSLSDTENLEKSVQLFKKLHDDYPNSEYGPSGLFMAGFICANELNNYEEAKAIYQQFLMEYPDNELAPSARAELDNMGLSPEEILQRNMAKEQ